MSVQHDVDLGWLWHVQGESDSSLNSVKLRDAKSEDTPWFLECFCILAMIPVDAN